MQRRQLLDLEVARAGGRGDSDLVAFFAAHQAAAHGRGRGDESGGGVALFGCDEAVGDFLVALGVVEDERRAVGGAVVRDFREVNRGDFTQALAQLLDARLDVRLAFERGLVLGVLAQVAVLARLLNLARQVHAQLLVQSVQLLLKFLLDCLGHWLPSVRRFRSGDYSQSHPDFGMRISDCGLKSTSEEHPFPRRRREQKVARRETSGRRKINCTRVGDALRKILLRASPTRESLSSVSSRRFMSSYLLIAAPRLLRNFKQPLITHPLFLTFGGSYCSPYSGYSRVT